MILKRISKAALGVFVLLSLVLSPSVLASPDMYIKMKMHTDPVKMFGITSPAEDTYTETWISGDKMTTHTYDEQGRLKDSTIWRGDKGKEYDVDHTEKTYKELDLKVTQEEMQEALKGVDITVKVTPTSETKKIKGWNCRKYMVEMKTTTMGIVTTIGEETWASEDVHIDYPQYQYWKLSQEAANFPLSEDIIKEMEKIKGFPVFSTTTATVMGQTIKSTAELMECEERSAPEGTYDVPRGYTKT